MQRIRGFPCVFGHLGQGSALDAQIFSFFSFASASKKMIILPRLLLDVSIWLCRAHITHSFRKTYLFLSPFNVCACTLITENTHGDNCEFECRGSFGCGYVLVQVHRGLGDDRPSHRRTIRRRHTPNTSRNASTSQKLTTTSASPRYCESSSSSTAAAAAAAATSSQSAK